MKEIKDVIQNIQVKVTAEDSQIIIDLIILI